MSMRVTAHRHKRGDTFDLSGPIAVTMSGETVNGFANWTGRSQIRDQKGDLVSELEFSWINLETGLIRVRSPAPTNNWPVETVRMDIELISPDGNVISTDTADIEIVEDVTR